MVSQVQLYPVGEAQRIKLGTELRKRSKGHTLYVFDEPSTGLHMADVERLVHSLNTLADRGNSVLVIEHRPGHAKMADHLIDLGPNGGRDGGTLVGEGTPEQIAKLDTPDWTRPQRSTGASDSWASSSD